MNIGKYNICAVDTGGLKLDGGAMFGIIPKPLWEKTNPSDNLNRVQLSTRILVIRYDKRIILVDTGMGEKWDDKGRKIYGLENIVSLHQKLKENNINPEEVTDVILTHLHFDHAGGATIQSDGKILPTFPNAKYYVQKENFEWAMNPSERDRGSYLKENFVPLMEEGLLNFTKPNDFFEEGIQFINIYGHTFAQQLVKISDSGKTLLYCCDLIPFSSHVHLPYIMGYDLQPLVTLKEKTELLKRASEEEWILVFEHDPFFPAGTVYRTERGFALKEKIESL